MKYYLARVLIILFVVVTAIAAIILIKNRQPATEQEVMVPDSTFDGQVKKLPEVNISPRTSLLELELDLPADQKFNIKAPFTLKTYSDDTGVIDFGQAPYTEPMQYINLPIIAHAGATVVRIDLNFSYCGSEDESLCYFEDVRLVIPVVVSQDGDTSFAVVFAAGS
jgi:hypothetical protein